MFVYSIVSLLVSRSHCLRHLCPLGTYTNNYRIIIVYSVLYKYSVLRCLNWIKRFKKIPWNVIQQFLRPDVSTCGTFVPKSRPRYCFSKFSNGYVNTVPHSLEQTLPIRLGFRAYSKTPMSADLNGILRGTSILNEFEFVFNTTDAKRFKCINFLILFLSNLTLHHGSVWHCLYTFFLLQ